MKLHIQYREAKAHAIIVACVGWLVVLGFGVVGRGDRSVFGPVKWSDFLHFYTLGQIARTGPSSLLYDDGAQHERQVRLVPESADKRFIAVYGPQTAIMFAPVSSLPYVVAGCVWVTIITAIYGWAVWMAWKPARAVLPDHAFVVAAALAFPPAWQLAAYGQTTGIPILAFVTAWLALEAGRRFLAGIALGLLLVKPQLGLVLGPLALLAGEWRLIAGVLTSAALQSALVLVWFGPNVFSDYLRALKRIPASADLLEPDAYKMHSLATLTRLLPAHVDLVVWTTFGVAIVVVTTWIWKRDADWRVRCAILVLASVLVSPHVPIYDVALLALPILWLGGWLLEQDKDSSWFWQRVYWLGVAVLLPTAVLLKVQLSVLIMAELFVRVASRALQSRNPRVVSDFRDYPRSV